MKRYKHRKDGHIVEVEAELHGSTQGPAYYYVKDYCESHDSFIPIEDFEALFEPVKEECRCDICGVAVDECVEGMCGNCHIVLVALVQHGRTLGVKTGRKALETLVARVRAGKES